MTLIPPKLIIKHRLGIYSNFDRLNNTFTCHHSTRNERFFINFSFIREGHHPYSYRLPLLGLMFMIGIHQLAKLLYKTIKDNMLLF